MRTCNLCQKMAPNEAGFCPNCGAQFPVASAKGGMSPKTAVILVVAVCIPLLVMCTGIIAAIAIPNLLDAIERSRQKRAIAEIRTLATAIYSYQSDKESPPFPLSASPGGPWQEVPVQELQSLLSPDYIQSIPALDPWGKPYTYGFNAEKKRFYILCTGKNGAREIGPIPEQSRTTACYESDILWVDTAFVQYPEGKQRVCGDDVAAREFGSGR